MRRKHRITRPEAFHIILEACPAFRDWVHGFPELFTPQSWQDDSRDVMGTFLSNFARHLLALHQVRNTTALKEPANAVERIRKEGDASMSRVSMRDFLESLDTVWRARKVDPCEFLDLLAPRCRK
jgi:hypothetical protein